MERFMSHYQPGKLEHTTRDILARSIFTEISEGRGTQHGGVYLDAREVPDTTLRDSYAHEYELCLRWGVDLRHQLAEVAPGAHYSMGGVEINDRCETNIRGLYAAGEVSANVHGANRLNGNSLTELVVFGAIAGEQASAHAAQHQDSFDATEQITAERARIEGLLTRTRGPDRLIKVAELKDELRTTMARGANVVRTVGGLEETLEKLRSLRSMVCEVVFESSEMEWNNELRDYLELESMLTVAELVTRSALGRMESRGAHYLSDYPKEDNEHWLRNTVATRMMGEVTITSSPIEGVEVVS
jgi:fumarate reductase (CoM/CoB) subunit A